VLYKINPIVRGWSAYYRTVVSSEAFTALDNYVWKLKFSWTKIVRHQLVKGAASPDDPALAVYWADRRRKGPPLPVDKATLRLLERQNGRCPLCRGLLLHAEHQPRSPNEWELWLRTIRKAITKHHIVYRGDGAPDDIRSRLTHARCLRRHRTAEDKESALLPVREPLGLA
jgi:RNA-directed DNA polymerase